MNEYDAQASSIGFPLADDMNRSIIRISMIRVIKTIKYNNCFEALCSSISAIPSLKLSQEDIISHSTLIDIFFQLNLGDLSTKTGQTSQEGRSWLCEPS